MALIKDFATVNLDRVEKTIPKKRRGYDKKDEALGKFTDLVAESIITKLNWDVLKCVVIGSMGTYLRDMVFAKVQTLKNNNPKLVKNPSYDMKKCLLIHCSSGFKHSIHEILANQDIGKSIGKINIFNEINKLNDFYIMLEKDFSKVA